MTQKDNILMSIKAWITNDDLKIKLYGPRCLRAQAAPSQNFALKRGEERVFGHMKEGREEGKI